MCRPKILILSTLLIAAPVLLFSQEKQDSTKGESKTSELDDYIRVRPFSKGQQDRYKSLVEQISDMQSKIESYYEHLKLQSDGDCLMHHGGERIYCNFYTIQQDGFTWIPLQSRRVSEYGIKQKMIYSEIAYFKWNGTKVEQYFFETRKGYLGTDQTLNRMFYGNSIVSTNGIDPAKPPMKLIINEILPTGKGSLAQFAFTEEEKIHDKNNDTVTVNGKTMTLNTIYLREPEERLRVVRKYLDLLKRLEMRLQWNVTATNQRRQAELDRVLRESY